MSSPLLSLLTASAVWHSGLPPSCLASIRFLDALSLTVHRGDCIVIRHRDPAGARILLAALAGHPAALAPSHWSGHRRTTTGLRIRRAAIRASAIPWIVEGWHSIPSVASPLPPPRAVAEPSLLRTPMVHLFRASRDSAISAIEGRQWHRWGRAQALQGNAVVLVTPWHRPAAGAEPPPSPAPPVRELHFRHGRLLP